MDIKKGLLEEQARFLAPLPADWLHGRKEELLMEVWWGSVGDRVSARVMAGRGQAVTSIELSERLDPDTLEQSLSRCWGGDQALDVGCKHTQQRVQHIVS